MHGYLNLSRYVLKWCDVAGRGGMEIEITAVNKYPMLGKGLLRVSCERHKIIVNKLGIFPRKLLEI